MIRCIAVALSLLNACAAPSDQRSEPPAADDSTAIVIEGAGATFPYPVYTRWFSHLGETHRVRINTTGRSDRGRASARSSPIRWTSPRPTSR